MGFFNSIFPRPQKQEDVQVREFDTQYVPMKKHYVFNETGNIMLCATSESIHNFDEDIKNSFIDVSVFFTTMTKALHNTTNPITKRPYSIFNYQAVKKILNNSGMFVETNVEEGQFSYEGVGAPLGKALIQKSLNRNFSESNLSFSGSMFNGMAYQLKCDTKDPINEEARKNCRSGNIFFICELLMGLPQITAILVNIEPESAALNSREKDKDFQNIFDLAKLDENTHIPKGIVRHWNYKKRTYLFVPPKFLKNNVSDFIETNETEVNLFIDLLASKI